jgi:hypothetical protein
MHTRDAGPCTFVDVIQRVHKTVAEGLAHADVPSMQIMAQLAGQQKLLPFNALPYQVGSLHQTAPKQPCLVCFGSTRWGCFALLAEVVCVDVVGDL